MLDKVIDELVADPIINNSGAVEGACGPLALYVGLRLIDAGVPNLTLHHYYGYPYDNELWGHYVVESNGTIIDPAWRFFDASSLVVVVSSTDAYSQVFSDLVKVLPFSSVEELNSLTPTVLEYLTDPG